MFAALTAMGLSSAAGFNTWIPVLVVALTARYTDVMTLPQGYEWVGHPITMAIAAVLLVAELTLDKIPVIDHALDAAGTVIRPAVGALIFAATTAAERFEAGDWVQSNPWMPLVAGAILAFITHSTKAVVRPVVTTATVGVGTPVVSASEDFVSAGMSVGAVFIPIVAALFVVPLLVCLVWFAWKVRRR